MVKIDISTPTNMGAFALVDDDDFERANQYKWRLSAGPRSYVIRDRGQDDPPNSGRYIFLHKWLLGIQSEVDHINQDKADNRRANLRPCTHAENMRNRAGWGSSKLKGAVRDKARWKARIMVNRKAIHLGTFDTPEEAHQCYCEAAARLHGEFANTATKDSAGIAL